VRAGLLKVAVAEDGHTPASPDFDQTLGTGRSLVVTPDVEMPKERSAAVTRQDQRHGLPLPDKPGVPGWCEMTPGGVRA
jgi:hypothetical protein